MANVLQCIQMWISSNNMQVKSTVTVNCQNTAQWHKHKYLKQKSFLSYIVREKKGKSLYKRDKKGDYASFCV